MKNLFPITVSVCIPLTCICILYAIFDVNMKVNTINERISTNNLVLTQLNDEVKMKRFIGKSKRGAEDHLWNDYVDICNKYCKVLDPAEFGTAIMAFNTKMLLDRAPSVQEAVNLIEECLKSIVESHEHNQKLLKQDKDNNPIIKA